MGMGALEGYAQAGAAGEALIALLVVFVLGVLCGRLMTSPERIMKRAEEKRRGSSTALSAPAQHAALTAPASQMRS